MQRSDTLISDFKNPTPVQAQCWPVANSGRDLVAIAETGSGKTFAFALPAIRHLQDKGRIGIYICSRGGKPRVFVLAPTRELAMQTFDAFVIAGKPLGLISVCLYGLFAVLNPRWSSEKLAERSSEGRSRCRCGNCRSSPRLCS